jgi:hypothetical protein
MILRLLRDKRDKKALVAAFPSWSEVFKLESRLRTVTIDPAGLRGIPVNKFLERFQGAGIRRAQFLEEIKLKCYAGTKENEETCCLASNNVHWDGQAFAKCADELVRALGEIREKAVDAGVAPPTVRLAFLTWSNGLEARAHCPDDHDDEDIREALFCRRGSLFPYRNEPGLPALQLKGVEEFEFRDQALLRHMDSRFLRPLICGLVDLRVLRLEFKEEVLWSRKRKTDWSNSK